MPGHQNRGHILESSQKRFDIVGDLLRGDHQHRDSEGKGCIDKSFQPRHRDAAQPKSAKRNSASKSDGKPDAISCARLFIRLAILPQWRAESVE
jgi:hypothetical protein